MLPANEWWGIIEVYGAAVWPGLRSSIAASYLVEEIEALLRECLPGGFRVEKKAMGLLITGTKAG